MNKHRKLILIVALALFVIAFSHYNPTPNAAVLNYAPASHLAPDITFTLLDGKTLKLRSLAGHKVLLHFWASWCAPCREEFPALLAHLQQNKGDTVLLAVSGDANAEDARRFLAPMMRDYAELFKSDKVIAALDPKLAVITGVFQTFQLPETIIINPDLTLQKKIIGIYKE